MDSVQRLKGKAFISPLVRVSEWEAAAAGLTERWVYGEAATDEDGQTILLPGSDLRDIGARMGISTLAAKALAEATNPSRLLCGEELDPGNPFCNEPAPTASALKTLEIQAVEVERKRNKLSYRQEAHARLKFRRFNFRMAQAHAAKHDPCPRALWSLHRPADVLFTIATCVPYNKSLTLNQVRLGRLMRLDSYFLVLGQTRLTALRDRILCPSDFASAEDISADPFGSDQSVARAKEAYPSGCFYANGVFYDDLRHPQAKPLSAFVQEWIRSGRSGLSVKDFSTQSMEEVRFGELAVRHGQPNLYLHQGSCEHLWMVVETRLAGPEDGQDPDAYPARVSRKAKCRTPCAACKRYTAKFVMRGSERGFGGEFLCGTCVAAFHYDADGRKVGDFRLAHFYDQSALAETS